MISADVNTVPSRFKSRRGAMLAFVAVSMVGLLGMVAIAADIGAGNRQRRIAQTAADAAAIGGGRQIERHLDSLSVVTFALNSALRNGFPNSEVTVFYPPATGNHVGDKNFVEVLIVKSIPTTFGRIFNKNTLDVQARAVAGLGSLKTYCVYSLAANPAENGIELDGEMTTNCDIVSNAGIYLKHGVTGTPQPNVSAVGAVTGTPPSGHTFPGIPPVPDPFANLVVPTFDGTCEYTNLNVTTDQTIGPGDYCGGLTIKKNTRATMTAGTYIMRGGGITAGEIDATSGVTIINAMSTDNDPAKFKPIVFDNSCLFHLYAPSSGQFRGVAIFQDPAAPASTGPNDMVNDVCGMGTQAKCDPANPDIRGLIYFPTQAFNIGNSNGKFSIAGTVVSKYFTGLNGGGKPCVFLDTTGNSSVLRLSLVE